MSHTVAPVGSPHVLLVNDRESALRGIWIPVQSVEIE